MGKDIHIAIGSTMSKPGDVEGNLRQIGEFARQAASDGADLLLTPEMSASGYGPYPQILATAEQAGKGPIYQALAELAGKTSVVLLAGFVEARSDKDGDKKHLAHYVVWPDGRFVVQRKNRVTRNEQPLDTSMTLVYENDRDEIGQPVTPPVLEYFSIRGVRCAITICADSGLSNMSGMLAANGVELQLGPAGAGGRREDRVTTDELRTFQGRATYSRLLELTFFPGRASVENCIRHCRAMAAVNLCGYDGQRHYHVGHGMIVTPMGEIAAIFSGLPNLDRQRPCYTHAVVDVHQRLMDPRDSVSKM